jgi:enamine deaminase RidA (YjgF/YER057c/UK114 family)
VDRRVTTPHRIVNPDSLAPPSGFSHAVVAAPGRTVHLAGQTAQAADGNIQGTTMQEQFELAAANLVTALEAAGGRPEHVVSLQILVTDVEEYRAALAELGEIYRRVFGRHYPAVVLFGVTRLFDPAAKVELVAQAVVPER